MYLDMCVNSGDTIALIAGIIIVIFVAIIANPGYLNALKQPPQPTAPGAGTPVNPAPVTVTSPIPELATVTPAISAKSQDLLFRIVYTDKPYSYPSYRIPEHMETFGASEILPRTQEYVPFAFINGTGGGLTQVFSVPYPVWVINSTVVARTHPQYGIFRMALCYADSGRIIDGEEILNRGTSYRIVQTSNIPVYMIISTANIDSFYVRLETPRSYYDAYHPA
jgi:hypothetical protein